MSVIARAPLALSCTDTYADAVEESAKQEHRTAAGTAGSVQPTRYPTESSMFRATLPETYERFAARREDFLMDYGYNTARAYWGDLDDIFRWSVRREKDVLNLTDKDVKEYVALMRRRKYSENTVRRRMTALRGFDQHRASE